MAATHLIACAILERYHHIPVFLHPEGIIAYLTILLLNLSNLFRTIAYSAFLVVYSLQIKDFGALEV